MFSESVLLLLAVICCLLLALYGAFICFLLWGTCHYTRSLKDKHPDDWRVRYNKFLQELIYGY